MNVFTPLADLMIASDIPFETIDKKPKKLVYQAGQQALTNLKDEYDAHHKNLETLKYGQFLNKVVSNLAAVDSTKITSEDRSAIVTKLTTVAQETIKREKTHPVFSVFQRIGQFFKGHGFRTQGEQGLRLAKSIENWEKNKLHLVELEEYLVKKSQEPPAQLIGKINTLDEKDFRVFVSKLLSVNEKPKPEGKNKLKIYNQFSDDQKKQFLNYIVSQGWAARAFNIVEGASTEQIKNFVSQDMIELAVKGNPNILFFFDYQSEKKEPSASCKDFYYIVIESAIRSLAHKGQFKEIESLLNLTTDPNKTKKHLVKHPVILTSDEIKNLESKISFR